jgi:hypothetical protein
MAYLTYIIDYYDKLPSLMLFLHSHKDGYWKSWHTDATLHDNVLGVHSLNLHYILEQGYVNLRCILSPGCSNSPGSGAESVLTPSIWNGLFMNTSTSPAWLAERAQGTVRSVSHSHHIHGRSRDDRRLVETVPKIEAPCCAQFGVSRTAVLERPREDYIKFRDWLLATPLPDYYSGRVFEYLWHVIFGELAST